jgi:hypothetical protein
MTQEGRRNWPTHDSPLTLSSDFPEIAIAELAPLGSDQSLLHRGEILPEHFIADLSFTRMEPSSDTSSRREVGGGACVLFALCTINET